MKIRFQHTGSADALIEHYFPEKFCNGNAVITEYTYQQRFLFGDCEYKALYFEGIHIGYGHLALADKASVAFETNFETVDMHFSLKGDVSTRTDSGHLFNFTGNQHNILYSNGIKGYSEWHSTFLKVFEVNLMPSFFKKYLPDDAGVFQQFNQIINQKRWGTIAAQNYPITPAMTFLIAQIMHCKRKGIFKKIFIESKVIELLLLQLEQIGADSSQVRCSLNKQDIDKMYAVKEILEQNMQATFRLTDLARDIGTNEFTLKKGFKTLFGTTVFDYWQGLKMEKARKLLIEEGLNVQEVSEEIGYKHAHHFSAAFKRKFGVTPSALKGN